MRVVGATAMEHPMILRQTSVQSSAPQRDDLAITRAWESNDYVDFMAAVLLGVALTALALSVM
jgi:hypothetical protein